MRLAALRYRDYRLLWSAALLSLGLALLTLGGGATLAPVYLTGALAAGLMAFDLPARQSLVPHLVRREHLSNAISLEMLVWQLADPYSRANLRRFGLSHKIR